MATPSEKSSKTRLPKDSLFTEGLVVAKLMRAIEDQSQEILVGLTSALEKTESNTTKNVHRTKTDGRGNKDVPIFFKIQIPDLPANLQLAFSNIKGNAKETHEVVSGAFWVRAAAESMQAKAAAKKGFLELAFKHHASAERSIGAANAMASNAQIVSATARIKADIKHAEPRKMTTAIERYWKANIEPKVSAPKAADEMFGMLQFRWTNGKDVSHKFIADCVRTIKRKARQEKM